MQHETVLGICAGWQLMLGLEGVRPQPLSVIGKRQIMFDDGKTEEAYFLFSKYYKPGGWKVLATMGELPVLAAREKITISIFHPEVLNKWIIEKFLEQGRL